MDGGITAYGGRYHCIQNWQLLWGIFVNLFNGPIVWLSCHQCSSVLCVVSECVTPRGVWSVSTVIQHLPCNSLINNEWTFNNYSWSNESFHQLVSKKPFDRYGIPCVMEEGAILTKCTFWTLLVHLQKAILHNNQVAKAWAISILVSEWDNLGLCMSNVCKALRMSVRNSGDD